MPPAKKTTRKSPAKKAARKGKRPGPRKMSASHKAALAQGRAMSATVDRYLQAVNTPKRRGRRVSTATLRQRLTAAESRLKDARGVDRVLAAQEIRDLRARLAAVSSPTADVKALEAAFVKVAKRFTTSRGISYGAWRDAGVPASVLKRAGVSRGSA